MIQFHAHFDGENLCPEEPVSLPRNVPLRVTVDEAVVPKGTSTAGPLDLFERLEEETGLIDGPDDWAAQHDHYLHGAPKHADERAK